MNGLFEPALLSLLCEGECHGYGLSKLYRKRFGETVAFSSLYPLLDKFMRLGYVSVAVEVKAGRVRRVYRVTGLGRCVLLRWVTEARLLLVNAEKLLAIIEVKQKT